jgi:hypothetical protein
MGLGHPDTIKPIGAAAKDTLAYSTIMWEKGNGHDDVF